MTPADVEARIARGELDLARFDVTAQLTGAPALAPHARPAGVGESNLTVQLIDDQGNPTTGTLVVVSLTSIQLVEATNGDVLHLANDLYQIDVGLGTAHNNHLVYSWLELSGDRTITFDARTAKPIAFDVGDPGVAPAELDANWAIGALESEGIVSQLTDTQPLRVAEAGPNAPAGQVISWVNEYQSDVPNGAATRLYLTSHLEKNHMVNGWTETVSASQFADVDFVVAGTTGLEYDMGTVLIPIEAPSGFEVESGVSLSVNFGPFSRTEHYYAPGMLQQPLLFDSGFDANGFGLHKLLGARHYRAGQHYQEAWNQAVAGPAQPETIAVVGDQVVLAPASTRSGDTLNLRSSMFSPQTADLLGRSINPISEQVSLLEDGLLWEAFAGGTDIDLDSLPPINVDPRAGSYQLHRVVQRDASVNRLSTLVDALWTFASAHAGDAPEALPMLSMAFQPPVDAINLVHGRKITLPIQLSHQTGAPASAIASATLDVSFDDGATWSAVPVTVHGERATAKITHPAGAQFVSLRGAATDAAGSAIAQTVIRAYEVAP